MAEKAKTEPKSKSAKAELKEVIAQAKKESQKIREAQAELRKRKEENLAGLKKALQRAGLDETLEGVAKAHLDGRLLSGDDAHFDVQIAKLEKDLK